ncbi:MAG: hypothetical protein JW871_05245 [Endomicrobiales bacterium]|nr:hypothetical protein [Endomicrobiales bacterium]
MKKYKYLLALLFIVKYPVFAQVSFEGNPLIDGVKNPAEVVVTGRSPVFSWEYAGLVSSFTITVSDDSIFSNSGEIWNHVGSTTLANTINGVTRVAYNTDGGAAQLQPDRTYYWQVTIYGEGTQSTKVNLVFSSVSSEVNMPSGNLSLAVDWNNPFNPSIGQTTKFRFTTRNRDRTVQVRIFTLSGELVKTWAEQTMLQNAWYSVEWDGRNDDGKIVARGIYLVNLMDVGEKKGVTEKVIVIK